jgi:uncharacterized membrane protein YjjP (DUF1212 family)
MPTRTQLEEVALAALQFGCLLMEAGASARPVEDNTTLVAQGLGADRVDLRMGYASLAITIGMGGETLTRMRKVGALGVNQRLDHALRVLAEQAAAGRCSLKEMQAKLKR